MLAVVGLMIAIQPANPTAPRLWVLKSSYLATKTLKTRSPIVKETGDFPRVSEAFKFCSVEASRSKRPKRPIRSTFVALL